MGATLPDFGIGEFLIPLITSGLTSAGVGASTAGLLAPALSSGITGAGLGAATSAATGGDPGLGALEGGASLGLGSLGGEVAPALGLGAGLGRAVGGALGGAGGAAAGGADPLSGALTGGAGAYASGALGGSTPGGGAAAGGGTPSGTPAPGAGGGASAASSSLSGGLTSPVDLSSTPVTSSVDLTGLTNHVPSIGPIAGGAAGGSAPAGPIASGAAAPPGGADTGAHIGNWVADQLGLGPKTGNLLDKYGMQILQGGGLLYGGQAQKDALAHELAPLRDSANMMRNESAALSGPLFGGQLPAGAKAAVDMATQSAKARTRSEYASLGLSGSTMEADALNNIDRQAAAQTFQMADHLMQQGLSTAQLSDQLYGGILGATQQENQATSQAIANFVAQLAGAAVPGGHSLTLNLGT